DESLPQSMVDDLSAIFDNNDADDSDDLDLNELDQFILDTDDYFMSMDGNDDDHDEDLITPEQLLADIDSDESGTMSLDEFNAFFGGSEEIDVNDPEFSEIFEYNDADASGDLDNSELEGFIMDLDAYLEGGHDGEDGDHDDHGDDGHDDGDHSDFYVEAYLTDNWASGLNDYADPEFTISSGFSDVDNVQFELYDSDGMELTTLNIQPSDFTDQGDGSMIYYVDMDNLMLDVGCYTLTATVTSYDNNYQGEWTREDICIYDSGNDDNSDDQVNMFDWIIFNTQTDMPIEGSFDDYSIILAFCDMDESNSDAPTMTCGDDILKVTIADAMTEGAVVMFHDADMSGTISSDDMVHISPDIDLGGDWNMVRLYSTSADAYSDENPMQTPGFTGALGMLALLGAALLTRRD
ncbi:MAG: PGF-CTERM sorting domain-containing protein, partial [Candidatus Poseidoniaceae archaeon]|nr:PGF-CTERM sorting domain-containing protein [Candidatus Poseidoniaceae archaeon]